MMGAITHPASSIYKNDWNNFTPRIGVAYSFRPKWVFRSSFGMFTVDNMSEMGQDEYLATAAVAQTPGNPQPAFYLSQGPGNISYNLNSATKTANYVSASGNYNSRTATYLDPNLRNPYTMSWSGGFQYQIKPNTVAELSYQGSAGVSLINSQPGKYQRPTAIHLQFNEYNSAESGLR